MSNAKSIGTPMSPSTNLDKDEHGIPVDETKYRGMIGSLLYLTASRLDIMFSVCICARFQSAPKESHMTAVKRIIRYLIGTVSYGLWYPRSNSFKLEGFSDADLAGDKDDRSTSGTSQLLEKALISWNSKKQASVALSTTEAKYIAIGQCCAQLLWMSHQLDKPISHGRVVDLDDMEALNCKVKDLFIHQGWVKFFSIPPPKCRCSGFPMLFKNTWPDDFEISFDQAK
ncbi:PREDICTED: uncharacterized protein LOC109214632 [Nicotiana attenuata]|uniref:uncharacterized protein LOC109214632 n=1 Tax=Nicotiana attenuata TaxID=49451 RepID=UPI00090510FD|nr:PREDICTED: uncharacterized protein LOC109214632 [Nicotiana attenuata]